MLRRIMQCSNSVFRPQEKYDCETLQIPYVETTALPEVKDYLVALKRQAMLCEYNNHMGEMFCDQMVVGISGDSLRKHC